MPYRNVLGEAGEPTIQNYMGVPHDDRIFLDCLDERTCTVGAVSSMGKPQTWDEALDCVLAELRDLMLRKHHDYGPKNISELGVRGVFVRCWDKINRLKRLAWEDRVARVDETTLDTWRDLANYGIIAVMLERGWWDLPAECLGESPYYKVGGSE